MIASSLGVWLIIPLRYGRFTTVIPTSGNMKDREGTFLTSRDRVRFPKEVIDSVVAHSKEAKKDVAPKKRATTQDIPMPSPSPPSRSEASQTTPRVGSDFEKIFSKIIGSPASTASKPVDYSETYQRAFGRTTGEKNVPPKQDKAPMVRPVEAEPSPKPTTAEKGRVEGLSANYTTVFSRLVKDEDADETKAEIRESLKQCVGNFEEVKTPPAAAPSEASVFETLSYSSKTVKDEGSNVTRTQEAKDGGDTVITPSSTPVRRGKSVFEMLSHDSE